MKSWKLMVVAAAALSLTFAANAEEGAVEDTMASAVTAPTVEVVQSGSAAVDQTGNRGHIHVVQNGDTLWAISDAYLTTPWVWPAVWQDNEEIENPHRIFPGDHIWISSTNMRKVTPEEAVEMVAAEQLAAAEPTVEEPLVGVPADEAGLAAFDDVPAAMDEVEVLPIAPAAPTAALLSMQLPGVESFSYITEDELNGATSIVSSPSMRTWLAQGDPIVLGLGEGETAVGRRYDVFANADPVRDPETGRTYGYFVEVLGWVEVKRIHGDSSTAEIRMSTGEITRGAKIVERERKPATIAMKAAPANLEARIIYLPAHRTQASNMDYVFIDRGTVHGVEVGTEIMAYDAGALKRDRTRGINVRVPAHKVADLVIVSVQPRTSVAYVLESRRELTIGDTVRGLTNTNVASR
ncbi:MAG: LysM peptidoglycan-binding domain-containing protein [Myxococcota bacterium]|nr:LysM peptidoglycan-binding domain-containing protein [Myxococcota bacterium]